MKEYRFKIFYIVDQTDKNMLGFKKLMNSFNEEEIKPTDIHFSSQASGAHLFDFIVTIEAPEEFAAWSQVNQLTDRIGNDMVELRDIDPQES